MSTSRAISRARRLYENILARNPDEPGPLMMLAELDMRDGRLTTARKKLEFVAARHPDVMSVRVALASVLEELGDTAATTVLYEQQTDQEPDVRDNWVNLASALQTAGRIDDAVSAFRHVVATWPDAVAGYFGLAAIDPALLSESDVGRIRDIASDGGRPVIDRVHASFALGNVLEKRQDFDGAFSAFSEGSRLRRENASLKPEVPEWMLALPGGPPTFTAVEQAERVHDDFVRETQLNFTPAYVAKFMGGGEPSRAPIFIVGGRQASGREIASKALCERESSNRNLPPVTAIGRPAAIKSAAALLRSMRRSRVIRSATEVFSNI